MLVAAIENDVSELLTMVRRRRGIKKKQLVASAVEEWVNGKLNISDVQWEDERSKQFSAAIDKNLKKKFDEKIAKINGVKNIILSLVIKKWIEANYSDLEEDDEVDIL